MKYNMIDKQDYAKELQRVLDELYPLVTDFSKMKRAGINPEVYIRMSEYVTTLYGGQSNNSKQTQELIDEHHRLLDRCLKDMGID